MNRTTFKRLAIVFGLQLIMSAVGANHKYLGRTNPGEYFIAMCVLVAFAVATTAYSYVLYTLSSFQSEPMPKLNWLILIFLASCASIITMEIADELVYAGVPLLFRIGA
jgi:hypothetical protein